MPSLSSIFLTFGIAAGVLLIGFIVSIAFVKVYNWHAMRDPWIQVERMVSGRLFILAKRMGSGKHRVLTHVNIAAFADEPVRRDSILRQVRRNAYSEIEDLNRVIYHPLVPSRFDRYI